MKTLPRVARWYLFALYSIATAIFIANISSGVYTLPFIMLLVVWTPIYALLDYYEFTLEVGKGNSVSMTVSDAPTIFLAAVAGLPGVVALVVATLSVEALRRKPWYKALFNASGRCLTYSTIAWIHSQFVSSSGVAFNGATGLVAFVLMAALFYGINTLLVATVVALSLSRPLLRVYRDSFFAVHWVHFATTPFGALAAAIWSVNPWLLPLCILPLLLLRRWFKTSADLQIQNTRNEQLAREQAELAAERERLLAELQVKQEELVRSSKLAALGTFAAGIGHEFNNLLAGMLGFAQLGLASDAERDKNEALEVAVRLAMRGRSITGGLLTFARRRDAQRVPYMIDVVVEETLALVERELNKQNVTIERRFEPTPETMCDPGQIQQVVLNLVNNARDAMREQGGGTITISVAPRGAVIELTVADTGHGIPEHLLDQIFQPFVTTKGALNGSSTPGTGLGLAISLGIVEGHGGTMEARSTPGQGATMVIRLPVVQVEREAPAPLQESLPPLRVLVVDDEVEVGRSLARLLEACGHMTLVAEGGESALRAYQVEPFDVVITDVVMPGMSGVDLAHALFAIDPHACVLAMSGQGSAQQLEMLREVGVEHLLRKPFTLEELNQVLGRTSGVGARGGI